MNYSKLIRQGGLFATTCLLFIIMAVWLLQNNYISDDAQYKLATIRAFLDSDSLRLESLGFEHPQGPILALLPFYLIPWLQSVAPFALSIVTTAALIVLWYKQLAEAGYSLPQQVILLILIVINPAILWSATSGGDEAISLLLFYLLYRSTLRVIYDKDIRSFMAFGLVIAAFIYFDVASVYLLIVLLPLLLFIVPIPLLRESPLSIMIIIGMPMMIISVTWIYFNWIFFGEPLAFLNTYGSAFTGAITQAETLPWLRDFGGQLALPTIIGLAYAIACYPVLLLLAWRHIVSRQELRVHLILMLYPVISIGIATLTYFLASPLQITALIMASVMAELGRTGFGKTSYMAPLILLLSIGTATSWVLYVKDEYSPVHKWTLALSKAQENNLGSDSTLGHWLAVNRLPTMIDFQSGYKAIVARGDAYGLLLPFSNEYRLAIRSDRPNVPQIAVPEPDTTQGRRDKINARFPHLYESGMPGYKRVYDEYGWRIYRRIN